MVYSTRRFVLPYVILFLCFSVLLALRLPRLGKRELILVLFMRLFHLCLFDFVGFLFLLVTGRGCGFLLPFFGKTIKQFRAKCLHFSKMQFVFNCYTAVLYESLSKLYTSIYKNSAVYIFDCRVTLYVFILDTGIEQTRHEKSFIILSS